jgi:hypothetical protein
MRRAPSRAGQMRRRDFITALYGGYVATRGTRAATVEDEADRLRSPFGQSQRYKRER